MENRQLIQNALITNDDIILISLHRHDFKTHTDKDGQFFLVDGGILYSRRSEATPKEDLTLYEDDPFEMIRLKLLRASFGVNGDEPLKYIRLSEIDYLDALIEYEQTHRPDNFYLKYYLQEREYRNNEATSI